VVVVAHVVRVKDGLAGRDPTRGPRKDRAVDLKVRKIRQQRTSKARRLGRAGLVVMLKVVVRKVVAARDAMPKGVAPGDVDQVGEVPIQNAFSIGSTKTVTGS
jgi:hypothetical protein